MEFQKFLMRRSDVSVYGLNEREQGRVVVGGLDSAMKLTFEVLR